MPIDNKKNVGSEFPDASNKELYMESKCYAENHHNIYHVMMTMVSCTEVRYDLEGGRENLPS